MFGNLKIRLKSIKIKNFKNISNSVVEFESEKPKCVTGIYGSNGSGKTAVIDLIDLLKHIIMGDSIKFPYYWIAYGESNTSLTYTFEYKKYSLSYSCNFAIRNNSVFLAKESLEISQSKDEAFLIKVDRLAKSVKNAIKVRYQNEEYNFKLFDFEKLVALYSVTRTSQKSFIWSSWYDTLDDDKIEKPNFKTLINNFIYYASARMTVIKVKESSLISAKDELILHMDYTKTDMVRGKSQLVGILKINLLNSNLIPVDAIEDLKTTINQCNKILSILIPDFFIGLQINENVIPTEDGKLNQSVNFYSNRYNVHIPLVFESEGIKKIISMTTALIACYNKQSTLLAVDELDSGIFEYLLGQIVDIFDKSGKGQLIFTSHNLRILEVVNPASIVLSTLNPDKRFIKFRNVKPTNNFRNMYIRSLLLGGQSETLYEPADDVDLRIALKSADDK